MVVTISHHDIRTHHDHRSDVPALPRQARALFKPSTLACPRASRLPARVLDQPLAKLRTEIAAEPNLLVQLDARRRPALVGRKKERPINLGRSFFFKALPRRSTLACSAGTPARHVKTPSNGNDAGLPCFHTSHLAWLAPAAVSLLTELTPSTLAPPSYSH